MDSTDLDATAVGRDPALVPATIYLGSRCGAALEFAFKCPPELRPDDVFLAANRIEELEHDLAVLPHAWQRHLRRAIDLHRAPSMSVGDAFVTCGLAAEGCSSIGVRYRVERLGWSTDIVSWSAQ